MDTRLTWLDDLRGGGVLRRASLAVRKRLPVSARHLLRLARHINAGGQASPWLPADLLTDCRMCASRHDLVRLLPQGGRVAEVGVARGAFSRHILSAAAPEELHLVDLDFTQLAGDVADDARSVLHRGLSYEVLAAFPDDHFDWVYIDADHSYAGASRDAAAAARKVKPGGFLVFNDFAHADPFLGAYGVHRAVAEFAIERHWQAVWLAFEPSALYDIALRRPSA